MAGVSDGGVIETGIELVRGRNGYFHLYSHYADLFGVSERTVKRWVDTGRKAGDECPLDDADGVRSWWGRRMTKVCPESILRLAVKGRCVEPEVEEVVVEEVPVEEDEKGLVATLNRLEELEVLFAREAKKGGGAKAWLDTIARMGPVMKQLREEEEKLGRLIPKDEAERIVVGYHGAIERGVRELVDEMGRVLGLEVTAMMREEWGKVCDRLFVIFGKEVFGEGD